MSIARAAHDAVNAVNKVATLPGTTPGQRLAMLLQLQRHVDGLVNKATGEAGHAPAASTGD